MRRYSSLIARTSRLSNQNLRIIITLNLVYYVQHSCAEKTIILVLSIFFLTTEVCVRINVRYNEI